MAGLDEVKWPDEPMFDWLVQAAGFLGLVAVWLAPVGLLWRALGQAWLPDQPALRFFLMAGPALWLFFPLTLLSSMVSASRWQVLNGRMLGGLLRLSPSLLIFYPVTAALLAAAGALGYLGLFSPAWYALPLAAAFGAAALLIHARLVGRLGWQLQQLRAPRSRPAKAKRKPKQKSRAAISQDPWAAEEEGEEDVPAAPGYRVVEVPEPKAPRPHYMDPEPEPYTMADTPAAAETAEEPRLQLNQEAVEREIELRTRTPPNPPPEYPMFSGVWTFPFYQTTMSAWVLLAVFSAATAAASRALLGLIGGIT
ncbi:MAG: hypothetical protein U0797_03675 [Gemmataceae bacterium]